MKTSESIAKIAPALLKAQQAMHAAPKTATNPHFKSKYADLSTVIDAVKGPLNDNGIMFMQTPSNDSTGVQVTTRFQHESGEFIEGTIYLPVPQQTPQAYGSAITYGKRYGLQSMGGLPSEDDDGQAASEPKKAPNAADRLSGPHLANQPATDAFAALDPEEQKFLREQAESLAHLHKIKGDMAGWIEEQKYDNEEKLALWSLLPSDVRAAIKRQQVERRQQLAEQA